MHVHHAGACVQVGSTLVLGQAAEAAGRQQGTPPCADERLACRVVGPACPGGLARVVARLVNMMQPRSRRRC
jgi:hypothetical protein